ncbi:MAG TPA: DUF1854 domain-containing protein [Firmicutes bacterium]|nr:DUF1854 domain-containing protein [Bacillota bacterium]
MYRAGQQMQLLDPKTLKLYKEAQKTEGLCLMVQGSDGTVQGEYTDVRVHQMFPLTRPNELITICDKDDNELGVIANLAELEGESLAVLSEELELNYFIPKIRKILEIKEEFGVIRWRVETDKGPRSFEVRSRHDIRSLGGGRFIVRDMDGNRYDISNMSALDAESRSLLELEV